jgi:single-strand DNA-binding protein
MNKVILIGRITKDPELRNTPTGVPVVSFTIAVNRTYQDKNGERQADFINCIAWRNQAENLARFIKKGAQIAVDGSLQTRSYDDQNGVRRFVTEVMVNQITFLEAKRDNGNEFGDLNQTYSNNYQNNNYNNNNYQNMNYPNQNNYGRPNNQAPQKEENPFDDIDKEFDISNDDLPF